MPIPHLSALFNTRGEELSAELRKGVSTQVGVNARHAIGEGRRMGGLTKFERIQKGRDVHRTILRAISQIHRGMRN